jgi:hypothetical protein
VYASKYPCTKGTGMFNIQIPDLSIVVLDTSVNMSVEDISFKNHDVQCSILAGRPMALKWSEGLDPSINSRHDSCRKVRAPLLVGNPRSG